MFLDFNVIKTGTKLMDIAKFIISQNKAILPVISDFDVETPETSIVDFAVYISSSEQELNC